MRDARTASDTLCRDNGGLSGMAYLVGAPTVQPATPRSIQSPAVVSASTYSDSLAHALALTSPVQRLFLLVNSLAQYVMRVNGLLEIRARCVYMKISAIC